MHPAAHAIERFVRNPFTQLAVAVILVVTGAVETYDNIVDEAAAFRPIVGHGVLALGLVHLLQAVPLVIDGLERWTRGVDTNEKPKPPEPGGPPK
jgi:hypothetical protein